MGGGTRASARRNPATGSRSLERLRLCGPPFTVLPEESGRRSAPASTRGSLGRHRVEPLEQAAAPTDRALGLANAFPSNPALPPPANGRCSRRAPLPPSRDPAGPAVGASERRVWPEDLGCVSSAASVSCRSSGHNRVGSFRPTLTSSGLLFFLCPLFS